MTNESKLKHFHLNPDQEPIIDFWERESPDQEPVAWAEFDGEGGYHFRAYENNEDYAEQWDKRNPNHVGWVKPLYAAPRQRNAVLEEVAINFDKMTALGDTAASFAAYVRGMKE